MNVTSPNRIRNLLYDFSFRGPITLDPHRVICYRPKCRPQLQYSVFTVSLLQTQQHRDLLQLKRSVFTLSAIYLVCSVFIDINSLSHQRQTFPTRWESNLLGNNSSFTPCISSLRSPVSFFSLPLHPPLSFSRSLPHPHWCRELRDLFLITVGLCRFHEVFDK